MNNKTAHLKKLRQFLLAQLEGLTAEQFNIIPEGCNNNIIWNLGHLICAEQSICYLRAGQPITVEDKYFSPYRTGTRPEAFISDAEIADIKRLFISTADDLQSDISRKIFEHYAPSGNILKIYGIALENIDDALDFVLYHEGFHSGCIMALKRLVM